jgi:molecular chaperone GrpE (heat shock protein)
MKILISTWNWLCTHICNGASQTAPDPLDNKLWLKLVEECVELFDELDREEAHFAPQQREVARHVCLRLQEMLQRSNVHLIDQPAPFDRKLHQLDTAASALTQPSDIEIMSPGFRVDRRILRRARVCTSVVPPTHDKSVLPE